MEFQELTSYAQLYDALTEIPDDDDAAPPLTEDQTFDLWDLWRVRNTNGSSQLLLHIPGWFTQKEFNKRRPFAFVTVEHDDPDKGAVLFSDAWFVEISIFENDVYGHDKLSIDDTVERLDISDDDDYIDEAGKAWLPRSVFTAFKIKP
ncbi:hypothetical protein [Halosegnis longus]|uniref:hypothetical protein n=1 Tax=Halosegnis longus TaxID=2216012 RepID=UPI00129EE959|nr:hypothetical protein [Halosegnis longus]